MTSLGTDFEMHAIWQGHVEVLAAKVFVARKAHTIALCKAQGTLQSTFNHELEIPWGFLPGLYYVAQRAYVTQESVSLTIFVSRKGMICIRPTDICTRNLWQERWNSSYSEKPCVLCLNFGGACTTYYLVVIKLVSSDYAKILE
jgi:hypothetical protein